jgi:hypothetical protein
MHGSAKLDGGAGRRWWLTAVVALALVLRAARADACDCATPPSLDEAFGYADVIAQVTVLALEMREPQGREQLGARVRVERAWKGALAGDELKVAPRQHEGGCVYWFPDLRPQLLYLKRTAAGLEVARGECGRSRPLSRAAEEMAALDAKTGARPAGSAGAAGAASGSGSAGVPPPASPAAPTAPPAHSAAPAAPPPPAAGDPPAAGPAQGGCAACALGASAGHAPASAAALLVLGALVALVRRRRRAVLAVGAGVAALVARGGLALACDCAPERPLEEAFESADVVAEVAVTLPPGSQETHGSRARRIRLRVVRVWKGAQPGDELIIDRQTESSCTYFFEDEQPQLLYLKRVPGGVTVAGEECGRSRPIASAADEVAALGGVATPRVGKRPLASPSAAASHPGPDAPSAPSAPAAPSAGAPAAGARGCGACAMDRSDAGRPPSWWVLGAALLGAALARGAARRGAGARRCSARRSAAGDDAR